MLFVVYLKLYIADHVFIKQLCNVHNILYILYCIHYMYILYFTALYCNSHSACECARDTFQ